MLRDRAGDEADELLEAGDSLLEFGDPRVVGCVARSPCRVVDPFDDRPGAGFVVVELAHRGADPSEGSERGDVAVVEVDGPVVGECQSTDGPGVAVDGHRGDRLDSGRHPAGEESGVVPVDLVGVAEQDGDAEACAVGGGERCDEREDSSRLGLVVRDAGISARDDGGASQDVSGDTSDTEVEFGGAVEHDPEEVFDVVALSMVGRDGGEQAEEVVGGRLR